MPAIRGHDSKKKTRRYARDIDQIHADVHSQQHLKQYTDTKAIEDLPALGRWYCVECARWFESEYNYAKHSKGKPHKKRVKKLLEEPYTQKEAEAAIGLTSDTDKKNMEAEMLDG